MRKKLLFGFLALMLVGLLCTAALTWRHYNNMLNWLNTPATDQGEPITLTIAPGTTVRGAMQLLIQHGLVKDSPYVRLLGRIGPALTNIKVGEYELSPTQSPLEQLRALADGHVKTYTFTIPEGFTVSEIDRRLAKEGFCKRGDLKALEKDAAFLKELDIPQFEGYLLPDTYLVAKPFDIKTIVRKMVSELKRVYAAEIATEASKRELNLQQVLTIASIVEKESGGVKEYPLVSSVIFNRLKRGMRLQMDPTVIYGIPNFNGNLTRRQLEADHPWNTYTREGLPKTPICNPGIGAIKATVNPAQTDYLFFVSMNNGRHVFTSNLADHNRAVQKYQIQRQVGP
jgi:UPF0755 protein